MMIVKNLICVLKSLVLCLCTVVNLIIVEEVDLSCYFLFRLNREWPVARNRKK